MARSPFRQCVRRRAATAPLLKNSASGSTGGSTGAAGKRKRRAPYGHRRSSRRGAGGSEEATPESDGAFNPLVAPEATRRHAIAYQCVTVLGSPPPEDWLDSDGESGTIKLIMAALKMPRGRRDTVHTVLKKVHAAIKAGEGHDPGFRAIPERKKLFDTGTESKEHIVLAAALHSGMGV